MRPPIAVDRFISNGASWIDLANGGVVRLRVLAAGGRRAQLAWTDMCGAYAPLRHPALNPLLDYGALDRARLFEAYASLPPVRTTVANWRRLLAHASQFLQAHGVDLDPDQTPLAHRERTSGPPLRGRPFGVVLQQRSVLRELVDALDEPGTCGAELIVVAGGQSSGLRTLQVEAARLARVRGYVPVTPSVIVSRPWLLEALVDRHVCVFVESPPPRVDADSLQRLLSVLGGASTRRHLVIAFSRHQAAGWNVIRLRPMGVRAMASMVFVDSDGPSIAQLFEAARGVEGRPGLFLEQLSACAFEPHASRGLIAHEATQPYGVSRPEARSSMARPPSRTTGVLVRAAARADALARRGRHAAAVRLLARATRVLSARGDSDDAARCAERLGRLHLSRGQVAAAATEFERARAAAHDTAVGRAAALGLAEAWLEDGRVRESEALLRSIAIPPALENRRAPDIACALARCLYWQGRFDEAYLALKPHVDGDPDAMCLALASTVQLADGAPAAALQLARRAAEMSPPEALARVECALAAALAAGGDLVSARQHAVAAVAAARRAHRPIDALRARIGCVEVVAQSDRKEHAARHMASRLLALAKHVPLPRLARFELEKTAERVLGAPVAVILLEPLGVRWPRATAQLAGRGIGTTALETLLEVWQTATDDREALDRLCATTLERVRAASVVIVSTRQQVIGHGGKPWDGRCAVVHRALAAGASAGLDVDRPLEAAEVVKFGGEVVGVVVCRWIPGAAIDPERAAATLKATAIAAAAPVRSVLDRSLPSQTDPAWSDLLGESAEAVTLREATARAARAPYPVLIEGESGSGKELVARAVHRLGPRRDRRFCAVNCAALSDELLEAELFGHTKGAFTGALSERSGLFEEADGGTLLLDEIGELSPRAQAKLLRVIQEGEIRRVGESFSRRVDVRIVAATNRRLEQEAAAGRFRTDLRFRLDVIRVVVPPLRERAVDIPLLAVHFWNDAARRVGSRATLSPDALAALARYDWPGNVRELQNVIAWMAVHSPRRGRIGASSVPARIAGALPAATASFEAAREEFERRFIRGALARANGHRASAAESLGITRQGLAKMMRRLKIDDRPFS